MRLLFAPFNMGSKGAKDLARAVGAKRTRADKQIRPDVILCNWGRASLIIRGSPKTILNSARSVAIASDKLSCLRRLTATGVSSVPHTTDLVVVRRWVQEGSVVYGRRLLNASQGKGIVIIERDNQLTHCPLYTKGILNSHEYRVHVFRSSVIDVAKKRRRSDVDNGNFIKNLSNGWVYCRDNITVPENLKTCAIQAIQSLNLDFGAVDIIYKNNVPYVLEINTAPGLQGTTLTRYAEKFKEVVRSYDSRTNTRT